MIDRVWAMPNRNTFQIRPIAEWLCSWIGNGEGFVDPFCGDSEFAEFNSDLKHGVSAFDFLSSFDPNSVYGVIFDPPYSPRQISECYKSIGLDVSKKDTQNQWTKEKDKAAEIICEGGLCISFGWNSSGLGKKRGFELIDLLLVNHGAAHNDTICIVEEKLSNET